MAAGASNDQAATLLKHSPELCLLANAGRLLLEYNESSAEIHGELVSTAKSISPKDCRIVVSYGSVEVALGDEGPRMELVSEIRFNVAVQSRVHSLLETLRRREVDVTEAIAALQRLEVATPRIARWVAVVLIGGAAACLAQLQNADRVAQGTAAVAAGVGLVVRQELGRRRVSVFTLPFVAALVAGVLGGFIVRLGWTRTPALALVIPALVLVPGPHIIVGLLDVIDNYIVVGAARLTLASGLLVATTLGIVAGASVVLHEFPQEAQASSETISFAFDVLLAGGTACGFAAAYNTPWRPMILAALGGMVGHGMRYWALQSGCRLDVATLLGGYCIGVVSASLARAFRLPVAVIAFAGAVTMMPGVQIYRALGAALRFSGPETLSDPSAMAEVLGRGLQGTLVAGALALGVVAGIRTLRLDAARWFNTGRKRS